MTRITHLLDDFGMGGVTQALTLFEQPVFKQISTSDVVPIKPDARLAPKLEADLIIDHMALSWGRLPFLISLRARNPKARIVHVEHSYTRGFEKQKVPSKARFRRMIRLAAFFLNDIVCVSEAQQIWLTSEVGIKTSKVRVIYPWTNRKDLFCVPDAHDRGNKPLNLLAYGRYADVKNFAELIAAMRDFSSSEVRLTVFGDGPRRNVLQALAADLPNVDVFGPTDDPSTFLEQSDAVIIPSRYEAFGLVATEARMAGRAIIAADVDGLPEQARVGGRIAQMGCATDIVKAIRWAKTADLALMGQAGRQSVKGQHAQILRQWQDLIRSTSSPSNQRSPEQNNGRLGGATA
jgi:glycosyltransferase involved in cell wall biosynthesis